MKRLLAVAILCIASTASAEQDYFEAGAKALAEGRYEDAISQYEAYADRMPAHPDASFNRGLSYVMRIRNGAEKPGDLGRAAAAFEEALAMRAGEDTAQALALVHGEVARRRARRGEDSVLSRPSLDRVIVNLSSERGWGMAAVIASLLLAASLVLRRREGSQHLAGALLLPASIVALLAVVPLYLGARHLRLERKPGVLVVREAHMTDKNGATLGGDPIPEAARLEIGNTDAQRSGRLVLVRYGSREGWIRSDTVRVLRLR